MLIPKRKPHSINVVKERQGMTNDERRKCYNCGREGHLARDRNCPARGKSVQCEEGMDILLCAVVVRGTVM